MTEPELPERPLPAVPYSTELMLRDSSDVAVRRAPGRLERLGTWAMSPAGRSVITGASASLLGVAAAHAVRHLLQPAGGPPVTVAPLAGPPRPLLPSNGVTVVEIRYAWARFRVNDR